jgi:hypothetical protein
MGVVKYLWHISEYAAPRTMLIAIEKHMSSGSSVEYRNASQRRLAPAVAAIWVI